MLVPAIVGAAPGFWKRLAVGETLLVYYSDDTVYHERMALWPVQDAEWLMLTPDGDTYVEDLSCADPDTGPMEVVTLPADGTLPAALSHPAYRFKQYPTEMSLKTLIRDGKKLAEEEAEQRGVVLTTPSMVLTPVGTLVTLDDFFGGASVTRRISRPPLAGGSPDPRSKDETSVLRRVVAASKHSAMDGLWLLSEPVADKKVGDEVVPADDDLIFDGVHALVKIGDETVHAVLVAKDDVDAFVEKRCAVYAKQTPRGGQADLRASLAKGSKDDLWRRLERSESENAAASAPNVEAEVRTLWVDYDEQGERHKSWRKVVQESTSESWGDSPLEGPATMLHLAKHYERHGGDPRQWLQQWAREKHLEATDRAMHEMKVLMDIMYFAGSFDQLNVGALVCLEVAARRAQLIVEALAVPGRPCWDSAKLYSGQSLAEDGVSPALRTFVAKKAREESEIIHARAKARELRGPGTAGAQAEAAVDGAEASGGLPARGRGRGRGGGRGRTLPASQT